jgi:Fe-Mn family superoxide dismutase
MTFKLPKLLYAYSALEPHIDEQTMRIHHGKHHAGYVDNLNKALAGHNEFSGKSVEKLLSEIETVPEDIRQTVINNGGGHANHSLFWEIMGPPSAGGVGGKPSGNLLKAIEKEFSSLEKFKEQFTEKAMTVFGSGWTFLMITQSGSFSVKRHSFQNSPYMHGNTPILGIDVWEHAYYLKYQNRRADYIEAWWNIVNWKQVEENFSKASRQK